MGEEKITSVFDHFKECCFLYQSLESKKEEILFLVDIFVFFLLFTYLFIIFLVYCRPLLSAGAMFKEKQQMPEAADSVERYI